MKFEHLINKGLDSKISNKTFVIMNDKNWQIPIWKIKYFRDYGLYSQYIRKALNCCNIAFREYIFVKKEFIDSKT